ncbi:P-loop NTPase [Planctomycetota bacterium]
MTEEKQCKSCSEKCDASEKGPNESEEQFLQRQAVAKRMCKIKRKFVVLSGKGGVGKSTVAANLALSLSSRGRKVGLLDVDIHGPSIPKLFGLDDAQLKSDGAAMLPVTYKGLKVMSIGFTLLNRDEAVIWRGPLKYGAIRQFLGEVEWGELDYLIVDSPPGTGDEPLSVVQQIGDAAAGVIVTTPQQISISDVRKSVTFCQKMDLPVAGVIENMSGFVCPKCREVTHIFKQDGGMQMAKDMGVPFLGKIPIDPEIVNACDSGTPFVSEHKDSETALVFEGIVEQLLKE